jgi:hypothetical protein
VRLLHNRLLARGAAAARGGGARRQSSMAPALFAAAATTVTPRSWACTNLADVATCRLAASRPLLAQGLVPRVIHQTHKASRAALPSGLSAAVASWDALNPEYEHVYYSEAAMAAYVAARAALFPGFQQAYDKATSGAMRCDLWRYLLIWSEGGVYADADAVLQRPLSTVLRPTDQALTGLGQDALEQYALIYAPHHPIIRRVLEQSVAQVLSRPPLSTGHEVLSHTGPLQLCRALQHELRLGLDEPHWCLSHHHVAPRLASGTYGSAARRNSIRVAAGHFACHGVPRPRGGGGAANAQPKVVPRAPWADSCAAGVEHCPCVWRPDEELVVNAKFDMKQYRDELRKMGATYYIGATTTSKTPE